MKEARGEKAKRKLRGGRLLLWNRERRKAKGPPGIFLPSPADSFVTIAYIIWRPAESLGSVDILARVGAISQVAVVYTMGYI